MQNKPNLLDAQMNVTSFHTVDYENIADWTLGENKPNTNPIKPNTNPIKPNTNPIKANTKPIKANKMPKQTQNKPNQTQFQTGIIGLVVDSSADDGVTGAVFEDNFFDMVPGRKRTIAVINPAGGQAVTIRALDAKPVQLKLSHDKGLN